MPIEFESFPGDNVVRETNAYKTAIDSMRKGDLVIVFTPDDTHFEIAKYAIEHGLHVLLTKPAVKTLAEQVQLLELAEKHKVVVAVEYHKRFDPMYADARERIRVAGDFSFFSSFMSQPKFQLQTFSAWAGKSSDISYYLNSHHVDIHCWSMINIARPTRVMASAAKGIATVQPYNCPRNTEDAITLTVNWQNFKSKNPGVAVYTASWVAPKADVHSQQRYNIWRHMISFF